MARKREKIRHFHRLAGRFVRRYIGFVERTSSIVTEPADLEPFLSGHTPAIVALWHGQFLLATRIRPRRIPLQIMLARHGDAEVFAQALAGDDIDLIRGAGAGKRQKDRGGAAALRGALRALKSGVSVGMTADVPPGPARRAGEGIVTIAKMSGRPIIPLAVASRRYVALNTWSRMTVNMPFGKLAAVYGEPIYVPRDLNPDEIETYRAKVDAALDRATVRAYELVGADPSRATPSRSGSGMPTGGPAGGTSLALRGYRLGTLLMQPTASVLLRHRESKGREDGRRRGERLGVADRARPDGTLVWVHAASVGETNAVLPLIERLRERRPELRFLLTTGTVTSAALAEKRLHPDDTHQYVPLDAPRFVRRFVDHWRPDVAIFTESEIWPNLVFACSARSVPLVLVNARMSSRSFDRWRRLKSQVRPLFACFDLILAQNEVLSRRFAELGAPNVRAVGNLKLDAPPPPVSPAALAQLCQAVGGRPLFLAASTHADEEIVVGHAHRQIVQTVPHLLTIIAPRHPERGTAIAEELKGLGLKVALRSAGDLPGEATDVYIADTIGELGTLYSMAPVAFIGGSMVRRGGQNPIEAVRHGTAVIMGPHWYNFSDACRTLLRHEGMIEVADAAALAEAASMLLCSSDKAESVRAGAQAALMTLAGALEESVAGVLSFLPTAEELKRAS
ncbi:MAG: hypothetical protein RLZ98_2699 [Pseudomonadota bacterium]|jgi:3-deoxy-D-manno-octulosonic-acid transferase